MKQYLTDMATRIDAFSLRERLLIMIGGVLVIYFLFNMFLIEPLLQQAKGLTQRLDRQNNELLSLRAQQQAIIKRSQTDPDAQNRKKQDVLAKDITQVNKRLQASTVDLISPQNMSAVLESVLNNFSGLELESIKALPPVSLADLLNDENRQSASIPGVYQHGLRMSFKGSYLDTLAYLQALESLKWRFYWGDIDFEVTKYPQAEVTIIVNTLSLNEAWIGI
jgi:MSHA biogenesis protein MshJ